jgi:hypothetical protein
MLSSVKHYPASAAISVDRGGTQQYWQPLASAIPMHVPTHSDSSKLISRHTQVPKPAQPSTPACLLACIQIVCALYHLILRNDHASSIVFRSMHQPTSEMVDGGGPGGETTDASLPALSRGRSGTHVVAHFRHGAARRAPLAHSRSLQAVQTLSLAMYHVLSRRLVAQSARLPPLCVGRRSHF